MRADTYFRFARLIRNLLSFGNPAFDLLGASKGFCRKVVFCQQTPVVLLAGIDPRTVDVRHRDRLLLHPGRLRHESLNGKVIPMIILNAGG